MMPKTERILVPLAMAALLTLVWLKPLEITATQQLDAGFKRALVSFATARALNAVISVAQGIQVAVEPGGLGLSFAPGQILRPVNELVGQFAELMLAASVGFGVMKMLISIGSHWVVSLLLSASALGWAWLRWRGHDAQFRVAKVLFVMLLIRFAVPLVTVGSDVLFQTFMENDYSASQNAIAGNADEVGALGEPAGEVKLQGGLVERIRDWWSGKFDVGARIEKLKQVVSQLTEHLIKLIVVFLMQTLVLPLLLFWVLYRAGKAMFNSRPRNAR